MSQLLNQRTVGWIPLNKRREKAKNSLGIVLTIKALKNFGYVPRREGKKSLSNGYLNIMQNLWKQKESDLYK